MVSDGFSVAVVSISFCFVEISGRAEMVEIGNGLVGENLPYFGRFSSISSSLSYEMQSQDRSFSFS